ncbi:hypothetical protein GQ42DRAFT_161772 [Ramicandelaber brevisporus]|nr:hypothetical protein GQ42DRAFT_161772 [Ramicandelaber brevisporus]
MKITLVSVALTAFAASAATAFDIYYYGKVTPASSTIYLGACLKGTAAINQTLYEQSLGSSCISRNIHNSVLDCLIAPAPDFVVCDLLHNRCGNKYNGQFVSDRLNGDYCP